MNLTIRKFADTRTTPWANGQGETRELRAWPVGADRKWRLSIATVASDQAFSQFEGIDRTLMPLSPGGLCLRLGATTVELAQYQTVSFSGDEDVAPIGVRTPSIDLNFFAPKSPRMPTIDVVTVSQPAALTGTALVALDGEVWLDEVALAFGDSVFVASGQEGTFPIRGHGLVAIART